MSLLPLEGKGPFKGRPHLGENKALRQTFLEDETINVRLGASIDAVLFSLRGQGVEPRSPTPSLMT